MFPRDLYRRIDVQYSLDAVMYSMAVNLDTCISFTYANVLPDKLF